MPVLWWIIGGAVVVGFVRLVTRQMRTERHAPGIPTTVRTANHDEPIEDTARAVDAKHHHRTAGDEAQEYSDIRRPYGR